LQQTIYSVIIDWDNGTQHLYEGNDYEKAKI